MSVASAGPALTGRRSPFLARLVGVETHYQAKYALWGYLIALPWLIGYLEESRLQPVVPL